MKFYLGEMLKTKLLHASIISKIKACNKKVLNEKSFSRINYN